MTQIRELNEMELSAVSGGGTSANQTNVSTGDGNLQQNQAGKRNIQVGVLISAAQKKCRKPS